MNWEQNKIFFNYIIDKNYLINKDIDKNDILYINWDKFEMKCKYFLAFTVDESNYIIWSCDNPFIDQKTKYFSLYIKNSIVENKIFTKEILNELKNLIKNGVSLIFEEDKINLIWCLVGDYKKYKQIYIITEIIYL